MVDGSVLIFLIHVQHLITKSIVEEENYEEGLLYSAGNPVGN